MFQLWVITNSTSNRLNRETSIIGTPVKNFVSLVMSVTGIANASNLKAWGNIGRNSYFYPDASELLDLLGTKLRDRLNSFVLKSCRRITRPARQK